MVALTRINFVFNGYMSHVIGDEDVYTATRRICSIYFHISDRVFPSHTRTTSFNPPIFSYLLQKHL